MSVSCILINAAHFLQGALVVFQLNADKCTRTENGGSQLFLLRVLGARTHFCCIVGATLAALFQAPTTSGEQRSRTLEQNVDKLKRANKVLKGDYDTALDQYAIAKLAKKEEN